MGKKDQTDHCPVGMQSNDIIVDIFTPRKSRDRLLDCDIKCTFDEGSPTNVTLLHGSDFSGMSSFLASFDSHGLSATKHVHIQIIITKKNIGLANVFCPELISVFVDTTDAA